MENKAKKFSGIVMSQKGQDTIVVKVSRFVQDSKYHKRVKKDSRFMVHAPGREFEIGEQVSFMECSPISKNKAFVVI